MLFNIRFSIYATSISGRNNFKSSSTLPIGAIPKLSTDDGETKDYDKPEHFVHITLDADGNAKSDRATVKVEG
jgi:hypothetical protein